MPMMIRSSSEPVWLVLPENLRARGNGYRRGTGGRLGSHPDRSSVLRILLVDDSKTIRTIHRSVLEQLGHHDVVEADDGLGALARFHEAAPDLVLVDWNMPHMNGITLARKIREHDRMVPMIVCITEAEMPRVAEALNAGVNDYLLKPLTVESLGDKIKQVRAGVATAT